MWLTAGLFHLMVEQRAEDLAPLRQLVAGGDVLSPSHVHRALAVLRDGVVINGYGPTESTTFACCFRMNKGYQAGDSIPIGKPISNTTAYVLDKEGRPVPSGSTGELYIGGDGLARGYLNKPELTREKFVPDSFSSDPTARLYRTGDRVRACQDGVLEFLGRLDNQVKILGYRIEPGEIEALLRQHSAVTQAVVLAHVGPRREKRLVAYVVAPAAACASIDDLKDYLAARLPPYMVPAHIVRVNALPLTPNGKVDRSALPAPNPKAQELTGWIGPAAELETEIGVLWERVLHCRAGLDDNFFDLGGSSLQLMEIHAALKQELGCELGITDLFEYPTIRSLAGRVAGLTADRGPGMAQAQDRARQQKAAFARQKLLRGGV
jgi:aspartate racemase